MIVKFMMYKATGKINEIKWKIIDNVRQIHYRTNEDKIIIDIFFNDKSREEETIETDNDVYILNDDGKTIDKIY